MGKVYCMEFQRLHTQYVTHTFKNVSLIDKRKFTSSYIYELVFLNPHPALLNSWIPLNTLEDWSIDRFDSVRLKEIYSLT